MRVALSGSCSPTSFTGLPCQGNDGSDSQPAALRLGPTRLAAPWSPTLTTLGNGRCVTSLTPSLPQPVKKIPGRKMHGLACRQYISGSYNTTSAFNAICFDQNPFTCLCEKANIKAQGFQILQFYWVVFKCNHGSERVKLPHTNPPPDKRESVRIP